MGSCTSSLADDVITMTRRHSHSLKAPLKRALSFTSAPTLAKQLSNESTASNNCEKTSKTTEKPSKIGVSKTAGQLDSEEKQERLWKRKLSMRLRRQRSEQGMVVSRKNAPGSPVDEWLSNMDSPLRKSLEKQVRPNELDDYGLSPLHRASEMGNTSRVKFLIAVGGQVDLPTSDSQGSIPPIVYAANNGHSECIKLLVEAGAKVDNPDIWGNTALFKAACYNHTDCVSELLNSKADPNTANKWGALPLQYAALQGHNEVIKMLLEHGADVNLVHEKNVPPPVIGAAMRGYHKSLQEILKYKPDIEVTFHEEYNTALYLSLKHFLLHCNGCDSNISSASSNSRFQSVYTLLSSGAAVSQHCLDLTYCSDTMIPYLVTDEYILLIKMLLKAFPYTKDCHTSFESLFEHVTRLGQHKWELVRLVCSTGFTPTRRQLRQLNYTFIDSQQMQLEEFSRNPRSLFDQCRMTVRENLNVKNVITASDGLSLPNLLKDYVQLHNSSTYVI